MRRLFLASLTASLLGIAGAASAAPASSLEIQVMTQNQYIGADLFPLISAGDNPDAFNAAIVAALETTSANRTVDRVKALAGEIAARNPHLVGLQEVWDVECIPAVPALNGYPCNAKELAGAWGDHLSVTMAVLGSAYRVAAVVENFKITSFTVGTDTYPGIPFTFNGAPAFVQIVDRDVTLARSDVQTSNFVPCEGTPAQSVDGCTYQWLLPLPAAFGAPLKRGFAIVDATVGGKPYRFANTHLENGYADGLPGFFQSAQAAELIGTLGATTPNALRLVIVGDMNSSPNDAVDPDSPIAATPYMLFAGADLFDVWQYRPGNVAGLSCCQAEDLMNRASLLTRRVDLIFTREMPKIVKDARLVGEVAADRLGPPGRSLWPSDHAAVAAWWKN